MKTGTPNPTPEDAIVALRQRYGPAVDFLLSLKARGVALGLERMQHFAAALGHPASATPCIHIGGTNGKGSVAAMIESVLRAAGWRTGLYTSPHLVRLGERIQVNREPLSAARIAQYVAELRTVVDPIVAADGESAAPSYFEFMTAMALLHFQQSGCDVSVIEVGLGGRLDATNIVAPEVSVITSVGLDHCEILGDTLAQIAREKAGIIKPGRPVVIGRLPMDAETVVRAVAAERGSAVVSVAEAFGENLDDIPATNLAGDHQRFNAATAALALRQLSARWRVGEEAVRQGLLAVQWPGRWQTCEVGGKTIIVDGAHNAEAAAALDRNLHELRTRTGQPPLLVVGVLGRSRARALLAVCGRHARELHLVVPAQRRACSFEELEGLIPREFTGPVVRSTIDGIFPNPDCCTLGARGDTIVVAGSLYLAGEALARLDPQAGRPESELQDF